MKQLANYFLQGLLFLAPAAVTVYAFVAAFRAIDGWIPLEIPGLGVLVLVSGITVVGFVVSSFFAVTSGTSCNEPIPWAMKESGRAAVDRASFCRSDPSGGVERRPSLECRSGDPARRRWRVDVDGTSAILSSADVGVALVNASVDALLAPAVVVFVVVVVVVVFGGDVVVVVVVYVVVGGERAASTTGCGDAVRTARGDR